MLRRSAPLLLLCLLAPAAHAGDGHEWAGGEVALPAMTAYADAVDAAIAKTLVKGPRHKKPGADARMMITASDGGSRATYVSGTLDAAQQTELEAWSRKWILPVGEPGMALPVRVWWEKPAKDEKEKLKKGEDPTKPSPGMRYSVGYEVGATGAVDADEVKRAAGLVFTSAARCPDEVADMRPPSVRATFWHLEIDAAGAVEPIPQDLWVAPPDPATKEGRRALAAMEEAAAPEVPGAEVPAVEGAPKIEGPKIAAPKFEAPKAPKAEAPKVEAPAGPEAPELGAEEGEAAPPAREWTPLEVCVGAALAESRVRAPAKPGVTHVDHLPVLVRRR